MPTVLVVEDDPDIRALLDFNLRQEGFETVVTDYGSKALRCLRESDVDLVLLDLMLPDISGLEVCREARREDGKQIPVIMLTAKGQEADRLAGFECGADDYVVKPFSMREILLRVRAVLRRWEVAAKDAATPGRVQRGDIVIERAAHRVFVQDNEVFLTLTEYELLLMFVRRPGRVFSRQQLLSQVWKMPESVVTRTVDTHVKRLREKLGACGSAIETVRGVGYRFVENGPVSS
jgi:two-component system phosphate regulon response regulator PhoB